MLKESTVSKKGGVSEVSSLSDHRPMSVGVNVQLLRTLKNDRFELRNKLAGFTVVDGDNKDKTSVGSILINPSHVPARSTIMSRKSTKPDMSVQLRKTKIVHPVQLLQNTYRLEPDKPFDKWIVEGIIEDTFKHNLSQFIYQPHASAIMVKGLSEEIKFRLKLINYDRCRLICLVTIVQRLHQDFCKMCKSLLDLERDQFATYVYEGNPTIYAVGTVFGIYYE